MNIGRLKHAPNLTLANKNRNQTDKALENESGQEKMRAAQKMIAAPENESGQGKMRAAQKNESGPGKMRAAQKNESGPEN